MLGERSRTAAAAVWLCLLMFYAFSVTPAAHGWTDTLADKLYGRSPSVSENSYSASPPVEVDVSDTGPHVAPVDDSSDIESGKPSSPKEDPLPPRNVPPVKTGEDKVAYLTFDDGPSPEVTPIILDILKDHQVKATFFVVGVHAEKHPELLKQILAAGHGLGNHSYSHRIQDIYRNAEALLDDIFRCDRVLESISGQSPKIFRPPGGSRPYLKPALKASLKEAGFRYHDWNVCPGDSLKNRPTLDSLVNITLMQASNKDRIVILLHDSRTMQNTILALPRIIDGLKEIGFSFAVITEETEPIHFGQ